MVYIVNSTASPLKILDAIVLGIQIILQKKKKRKSILRWEIEGFLQGGYAVRSHNI